MTALEKFALVVCGVTLAFIVAFVVVLSIPHIFPNL